MSGRRRVRERELSEMLADADAEGVWREHVARFGDTEGVRPVVDRTPMRVEVTLSRRLTDMPEPALRETLRQTLLRVGDPDLPRFGDTAVRWLESDAAVKSMRGRRFALRLSPTEGSAKRLGPALRMARERLDPEGLYRVRSIRMGWREASPDLRVDAIASTDPLIQVVCIDERLAADEMPGTLLRYVVWREVCVVCAYDFRNGTVDRERLAELVRRHPEAGSMEVLCRELGWECSVPLGGGYEA